MFKFNKDLELPPQLKWKFSHEPELLGWTIRARNYNAFVANCMFLFLSVALIGLSYVVYLVPAPGEGIMARVVIGFCFYMIFSFVILSVTHQRMKFAYRFTQSGVECCEWKDFPEWALKFLKWVAGITAIFFVFMATIDPSFLLGALIGPGGIGLTYLSMAYSKSYREMQTQYHHLIYEWKDFTQLAIATNREVVDLKFTHFDQRLGRVVSWSLNIFCKRKQKEKVADFIRHYLSPDVPFIKAKVNVPLSTD
ncbi:hypothetical protein K3F43_23535 [Pseudomonas tussilaginis]|uniref:hypothetical protein n=1 Tax=unclassified Pseudomonas TaxID=196821 RepID=UPI001C73239B|nr:MULTISPECIES: hypothetical protein [unclassified Pseudomonas]QYX47608.1 hypothetical protein K3F43_23535 [Pseudomonas sp. S11A 273]